MYILHYFLNTFPVLNFSEWAHWMSSKWARVQCGLQVPRNNARHFHHDTTFLNKNMSRCYSIHTQTRPLLCLTRCHQVSTHHVSWLLNFLVTTFPSSRPRRSAIFWDRSGCELPLNILMFGILWRSRASQRGRTAVTSEAKESTTRAEKRATVDELRRRSYSAFSTYPPLWHTQHACSSPSPSGAHAFAYVLRHSACTPHVHAACCQKRWLYLVFKQITDEDNVQMIEINLTTFLWND